MKVYQYTGYAPAVEAAEVLKVKPRTLYDRLRRREITMMKVDGFKFFNDGSPIEQNLPDDLRGKPLQWVHRCASRNKILPGRIYEQIILGNIPAVTIGGRVFVVPDDPATSVFIKNAKIR